MKKIIIEARKPGETKWSIRSLCKEINFRLAEGKIDQDKAVSEANTIVQDWMRNYQHDKSQLRVALCK